MGKLTTDERDCLERLEVWLANIERLLGMYDPGGLLPQRDLPAARQLYTLLERGLEAEDRDCKNRQRHPPLTEAEQRWYARTIHEVFVHLQAGTNAAPEKWHHSLYEARREISHIILQMTSVESGD